MNNIDHFIVTSIYGVIAVMGGIARYLTGYVNGQRFKLSIFLSSVFVSGFSGYMFALLGQSLSMPQTMLYILAGTGGFAGEQTMKFIYEWITKKL